MLLDCPVPLNAHGSYGDTGDSSVGESDCRFGVMLIGDVCSCIGDAESAVGALSSSFTCIGYADSAVGALSSSRAFCSCTCSLLDSRFFCFDGFVLSEITDLT